MKKYLTLALAIALLTAFTGLSAAQQKSGEPRSRVRGAFEETKETTAAIPPADKLTLSATPNVASKAGCPVTAWLSYSKNPVFTYPGSIVTFAVDSGPSQPPSPCTTDATSKCKSTVKSGQTVHTTDSKYQLTSNKFTCPKALATE